MGFIELSKNNCTSLYNQPSYIVQSSVCIVVNTAIILSVLEHCTYYAKLEVLSSASS